MDLCAYFMDGADKGLKSGHFPAPWLNIAGIGADRSYLWVYTAREIACATHTSVMKCLDGKAAVPSWVVYTLPQEIGTDRGERRFGLADLSPCDDGSLVAVIPNWGSLNEMLDALLSGRSQFGHLYTLAPVINRQEQVFKIAGNKPTSWGATEPTNGWTEEEGTLAFRVIKQPVFCWSFVEGLMTALDPNKGRANEANELRMGESLAPGQSITSTSGRYKVTLQTDGDLVVSDIDLVVSGVDEQKKCWSSGTAGKGVQKAIMQADGNLVLYDSAGNAAWATYTNTYSGSVARIQDDGDFVVYRSREESPLQAARSTGQPYKRTAVWSSKTNKRVDRWPDFEYDQLRSGETLELGQCLRSNNRRYRAVLQEDGDLVVWDHQENKAHWSANTPNRGFIKAIMQLDGNLVLYDSLRKGGWATNTEGHPGCFAWLHDDGELIVHRPSDGARFVVSRKAWA